MVPDSLNQIYYAKTGSSSSPYTEHLLMLLCEGEAHRPTLHCITTTRSDLTHVYSYIYVAILEGKMHVYKQAGFCFTFLFSFGQWPLDVKKTKNKNKTYLDRKKEGEREREYNREREREREKKKGNKDNKK